MTEGAKHRGGLGGSGYQKQSTPAQAEMLGRQLGFDSGERFVLVAVTGYDIYTDFFGTVYSIIDNDTGEEVERSEPLKLLDGRRSRHTWIGKLQHLNGREDPYAA